MIKAILIYIIFAVIIIGAGYLLKDLHPNHAQIEVAWVLGLGLPIVPSYIMLKESV